MAVGVLKFKRQPFVCIDAAIHRVTHFGLLEFETVGQHNACPVFLAGHRVFDRLNIGLANTGDPNGRSSLVTIDFEGNWGEERLDLSRGDRSGNLPNQPAVLAAFDRDQRVALLPVGLLVDDHAPTPLPSFVAPGHQ